VFVILNEATACVLGAFPSKNLSLPILTGLFYQASQPQDPSTTPQDDGVGLPQDPSATPQDDGVGLPQDPSSSHQDNGVFVILNGATACVLGAFPSKNLLSNKPNVTMLSGNSTARSFGFASG
jgi:hypothetical protein